MPENLTLHELYARFERCALVQGTTKKKCRTAFKKLIAWRNTQDLDRYAIAEWQLWMQARGMSNASIRSYFGAASQVFAWAVAEEMLDRNPFDQAKKIRPQARDVRVWDPDEVNDLSDAAGEIQRLDPSARVRWVCMIDLASKSGLRVGEIWNLRWDWDIDLDHECVRVQSREDVAGSHWQWSSKGHADRTVPIMGDALIAAYRLRELAPWRYPMLKEVTCRRLQANIGKLSETQRKYPYTNFYRELSQIKAYADGKRMAQGKPPISDGKMHILRHTAITRWVEARVPVSEVQNQAGHASETTTLRVYAHVNAQRAMASVRNVYNETNWAR